MARHAFIREVRERLVASSPRAGSFEGRDGALRVTTGVDRADHRHDLGFGLRVETRGDVLVAELRRPFRDVDCRAHRHSPAIFSTSGAKSSIAPSLIT